MISLKKFMFHLFAEALWRVQRVFLWTSLTIKEYGSSASRDLFDIEINPCPKNRVHFSNLFDIAGVMWLFGTGPRAYAILSSA